MLRIFSCDLKLARLEDVVTLQDSWHVARCLKRFTTLSTDDRVIIFGGEWGWVGGGRWGGEEVVVGNFCMTHNHIVDERPCDYVLGGGEGGQGGMGGGR